MSTKHTPGKLVHFHGQATVLSSEETGAELKVRLLLNCDSPSAYVSRQEAEANAARVRACWNACEGIEDPAKLMPAIQAARLFLIFFQEYFHDELQCDHGVGICGCTIRSEFEDAVEAIKPFCDLPPIAKSESAKLREQRDTLVGALTDARDVLVQTYNKGLRRDEVVRTTIEKISAAIARAEGKS
jgi:hypothetical protein